MPKKYCLKRKQIIRGDKVFQLLYTDSRAVILSIYPLCWRVVVRDLPKAEPVLRIAVSVPKKRIASSVKRNRIKRKMREFLRLEQWNIAQNIPESKQLLLHLKYVGINVEDSNLVRPKSNYPLAKIQKAIQKSVARTTKN